MSAHGIFSSDGQSLTFPAKDEDLWRLYKQDERVLWAKYKRLLRERNGPDKGADVKYEDRVEADTRLLNSFVEGFKQVTVGTAVVIEGAHLMAALSAAYHNGVKEGREVELAKQRDMSPSFGTKQNSRRYAKLRDLAAHGVQSFPLTLTPSESDVNMRIAMLQGEKLDRFVDNLGD